MMIVDNKQIGFIYKNNKSIDKIFKEGEVVFERGFLREKTSTTLPITFGGVGKDLKDYRVYGNTYQNSTNGINEWNSFNKEQTDTYKVLEDGTIQLINSSNSSNGYTRTSKTLKEMCPGLNVGDTVYLYIESTWYRKEIYSSSLGASNAWQNGQSRTLTQQMLDDYLILYGGYQTTSTIKIMITKNQYCDTYEPYTGGQPSPNPDYLQEIVSYGDRTKNLLNIKNIVKGRIDNGNIGYQNNTTDLTLNKDSFTFTTNANWRGVATDYIEVEPLTFYIVSYSPSSIGKNFDCYDENKIWLGRVTATSSSENWLKYKTLENTKYIRYSWQLNPSGTETILYPQIEKNEEVTSYESYGYKIPVNVRSENLFDKDNVNVLNAYISLGNSKITSSNRDKCLYMPIKSNTTYTISKILSSRFVIGCVDEKPVLNSSVCNPISENQASNTTYTITSGNNSKYLVIFYYTTSDTLIEQQILDSIQIVEGSTVPDKYIPYYNETTNIYLDEPLRKIGDYADYIDFVNNKIVRKIRKIILDGSENWARSYGNNLFNLQHYLDDAMFIVGYGLSNYYRYNPVQSGINANTKNGEFVLQSSYGGNVMIKNTDYTVINDFKTWLSTHNTEILYPLATPTEESITLPNIPTLDGNNTLNIETEITPSQVYIKYKSNE